jgi:ornithine decarboxylase
MLKALDRNVLREVQQDLPLDSDPELRLDFSYVRRALAQGYDRPMLVLDTAIVRAKARRFMAAMPRVRPHYAVKANPHPAVLETLIEEGVGFEIASIAELDLLLEHGVPVEEVHYSNPVKSRDYIRYARAKGVQWYAIDGVEEMRKIVAIQPDAKLYVRLEVTNAGSDWPLSGKFGVQAMEVEGLLDEAVRLGADLAGVTFHVGSQCRSAENWAIGIDMAKKIFRSMTLKGLTPRLSSASYQAHSFH